MADRDGTTIDIGAAQQITSEFSVMMARLGQAGLYRTLHKFHEAVREIGYEIADALAKTPSEGR